MPWHPSIPTSSLPPQVVAPKELSDPQIVFSKSIAAMEEGNEQEQKFRLFTHREISQQLRDNLFRLFGVLLFCGLMALLFSYIGAK